MLAPRNTAATSHRSMGTALDAPTAQSTRPTTSRSATRELKNQGQGQQQLIQPLKRTNTVRGPGLRNTWASGALVSPAQPPRTTFSRVTDSSRPLFSSPHHPFQVALTEFAVASGDEGSTCTATQVPSLGSPCSASTTQRRHPLPASPTN